MSLFNELKRRNVFKVGFAYIVMAWLVLQVADVILNNITAPEWVFRVVLLLLGIGFLLALFFAWAYEMTPAGLKRESEVDRSESITTQTGKKLNNLILVVMALALGYFAYDKYLRSARDVAAVAGDTGAPASSPAGSQVAASPDKSIAVLPFVNMSADPEQEYFSDGIAEELLTRLMFADIRSGRIEQGRVAMENGCVLTGPAGGNCEANQIYLLVATGQRETAKAMLDDLVRDIDSGKHPVGNYLPSLLSSLFVETGDIAGATAMLERILETNDWFPTSALVFAPGGARLPEEISTDPAWLAKWADPRIGDVIKAYRENLLAWRAATR